MYYHLAFLLASAGFLAANILTSIVAVALARPLVRSLGESAPRRRSRLLLALRLFPTVASAAFALGLLLPAYLLFEPQHTGERPSLAMAILGVPAVAVVVAGVLRALASWRVTGRLERAWSHTAEPLSFPHSSLPIRLIRDPFPVVCLVGILRPRLYVARQVVDALTLDEMKAAVTHEASHALAFDNLKRLLVRGAPDVLAFLPAAGWLEQQWVRASEVAADACAASDGAAAALHLCAALVKVARLAPLDLPTAGMAVSALHSGGDLSLRVRSLVAMVESRTNTQGTRLPIGTPIGVGIVAAILLAGAPQLFRAVYRLGEAAVHWLI